MYLFMNMYIDICMLNFMNVCMHAYMYDYICMYGCMAS